MDFYLSNVIEHSLRWLVRQQYAAHQGTNKYDWTIYINYIAGVSCNDEKHRGRNKAGIMKVCRWSKCAFCNVFLFCFKAVLSNCHMLSSNLHHVFNNTLYSEHAGIMKRAMRLDYDVVHLCHRLLCSNTLHLLRRSDSPFTSALYPNKMYNGSPMLSADKLSPMSLVPQQAIRIKPSDAFNTSGQGLPSIYLQLLIPLSTELCVAIACSSSICGHSNIVCLFCPKACDGGWTAVGI